MTIGKVIGSVYGVPVLVGSTWKREDGVIVEISEYDDYTYPIRGLNKKYNEWSTYTQDGKILRGSISFKDLMELVSNPEESTPQLQEVSYTKDQIAAAFNALGWWGSSFNCLVEKLEDINKKKNDPEYQKYLELKAKFES